MQYPAEAEKNLAARPTKPPRWQKFLPTTLQGGPCKKTDAWFDFWEITHLWPCKHTDCQRQTKPQRFLLARSKGNRKVGKLKVEKLQVQGCWLAFWAKIGQNAGLSEL